MSNKSPFEIRLEILKMTAELMKAEYESNMEFITEMQENLADKGMNTQAMIEKFMPKPFSFDEMLAKSKQFYEFVNAKWVNESYPRSISTLYFRRLYKRLKPTIKGRTTASRKCMESYQWRFQKDVLINIAGIQGRGKSHKLRLEGSNPSPATNCRLVIIVAQQPASAEAKTRWAALTGLKLSWHKNNCVSVYSRLKTMPLRGL